MDRFVFLDVETTGLNYELCQVWEIGAIVRHEDGHESEYCWQIRPNLDYAEPIALRINRYYERCTITDWAIGSARIVVHPALDSEGSPVPADPGKTVVAADPRRTNAMSIAAELAKMLDGAHLVGAVPWFDERFLQTFLRDNGQCATNLHHLTDVEALAAGALRMPPKWNLDTLLAAFGIPFDGPGRHTALGDARLAQCLYDAVMHPGSTITECR